ncbi:MAG: hypothetical protein ABFC89_06260 [Methanospirillum sp.]
MIPAPPDPSLPARLREFHQKLPLAGDRPNAHLSLPDDKFLYLAAILRDTPVTAPVLSPEEWTEALDCRKPTPACGESSSLSIPNSFAATSGTTEALPIGSDLLS